MANKIIGQLPVASAITQTDIYHTEQTGVDAQVSADALSAYVMRSSRYAQISVAVTTTATIAIAPTVQNQVVEATLSGSSYTITFPGVTAATFPCRVTIMRIGATSQGILSVAGLNNYGGTIRLFNDQDCAVFEVVNTTGSTYAWELVSVLSTGSVAISTTPFTSTFGDMAKCFDLTTGAGNSVFNLPAISSSPGKEYIIAKADAGAGSVAVTPNGSDPIGTVNAAFNLTTQGANVHIKNNGTAWEIVARPGRNVISTSGALGTLTVGVDTTFILTAASTATLPATPQQGCRLTFKAKTTATSTISANSGQTIGTTTSTSFSLYAQEDYVTLEWDGSSIWYVMATNGPVVKADQTGQTSCNGSSAWTAIGNGLTLGTLAPGVYDFEIMATAQLAANQDCLINIGNGTTPLSAIAFSQSSATGSLYAFESCTVKGYVLTAAATIQGIYFSTNAGNNIAWSAAASGPVGRIIARRIG